MAKEEKYTPGVKYELVKSDFNRELAKYNYQQLLQYLSSITVTRDNVNEDLTKEGREVLKQLTEKKDELSKEPIQWHKDIMANYKSLKDPLEEQMNRISEQKKVVAMELKREHDLQVAEQNRINGAKAAILNFTNNVAQLISKAITDDDIVTIEKMIGVEKTKKNTYFEFLTDLITKCDELRPQIKQQKEHIRELQRVKDEEKRALETGDMVAAAELREKKEYYEQVITETGIRIHEKAFEQASTIDIVAPEIAEVIPKGRSNWKFKVDDIKLLQKKMPHLVMLVPNEEAIKLQLSTMKNDGSLDGKDQLSWNGITFYNDKIFTR